jgi:ribosomal-protein-alanine N-acetyltransferase
MQLATDRLLLRPFVLDDAPAVQRLVSAYEIAENTLLIPHPYPEGAATEWIGKHGTNPNNHVFAIVLRDAGEVLGAIGLDVQPDHDRGEIGYWIGVPYWGRGYMTEAARAVLGWAFESLCLNRVFAQHFTRNPASGRVMQKLGMKHEGSLRQHDKKWGEYLDVEVYGIVRSEWR